MRAVVSTSVGGSRMRSVSRRHDKSGRTGIEYGLSAALILVSGLAVLQWAHLI